MKTYLHLIFFALILTFSSNVFSQYQSRGDNYNYTDAESFYNAGNFYDALPLFESLLSKKPDNNEYQMKIGICHLYLNHTPEKAIEYIKKVSDDNQKQKNIQYYLARAYALNYMFKAAINTYNYV